MKRVISASKRTDIPAFYLRWLLEQVQAGWVDVANPLYRDSMVRVSLLPDDVAWIVFWSKNYRVFQRHADHFDPYRLFFQFTINAPHAFLEPDVPTSDEALRQVEFLSARYGGQHIAWRYDPITCWRESGRFQSNYDPDWFARMCAALAPMGVQRCFTSFADHYAKFRRRVSRCYPAVTLMDPPTEQKLRWAAELQTIALAHGIALTSCAEPALDPILARGRCIDGALLSGLGGERVSCARAAEAQTPGREACACTRSIDIGDYQQQECGYACLYCYANPNHHRFVVPAGIAGSQRP